MDSRKLAFLDPVNLNRAPSLISSYLYLEARTKRDIYHVEQAKTRRKEIKQRLAFFDIVMTLNRLTVFSFSL